MKKTKKIKIKLAKAEDIGEIIQIATQVQELIKRSRPRSFGKIGEFMKAKKFYLKELQTLL